MNTRKLGERMMSTRALRRVSLCCVLWLSITPAAHAQWAVVDVGAIAQLIEQIQTMREQLTTARDQLEQARAEMDAMTGRRNMERLLEGTVRNYLPADWLALEAAIRRAGGQYAALSAEIQAAIDANAVLSTQRLAALSGEEREAVEAARRSAALLQATSRQALATTSGRFASIQSLINAIGSAQDPKAIMDLQARIAAEQGMLTNEQTKLQVLYQAAQAEEWARRQRTRELAIASIGSQRTLPPMAFPAVGETR